jgi:hypothetical protein
MLKAKSLHQFLVMRNGVFSRMGLKFSLLYATIKHGHAAVFNDGIGRLTKTHPQENPASLGIWGVKTVK